MFQNMEHSQNMERSRLTLPPHGRFSCRALLPPREGCARYRRVRDREKARLPAIRTYGDPGGFVLAFLSGEGPLRMGREEGSGEPEEAWGLIREGAVRLRGPQPCDRGGSIA